MVVCAGSLTPNAHVQARAAYVVNVITILVRVLSYITHSLSCIKACLSRLVLQKCLRYHAQFANAG